jgi:ABC-type branched-subunit amino acid transport system ATPase component
MKEGRPPKLLEVRELSVTYGKAVDALNGISFELREGEITAMIGPNGAGKSTALKAITGLLGAQDGRITKGEIRFKGESIKGKKPHELVRKGISLVPERRHIFPSMSVEDNLRLGGFTLKQGVKQALDKVHALFPILAERRKQKAGTLSAGEQQMLALGRALVLSPMLLLLDEPTLGLSPNFVEAVIKKIIEINIDGTSVMIVEQNVDVALRCAGKVILLANGMIDFSGSPSELKKKDIASSLL